MSHTIPDYARPFVPNTKTDWKLWDSIYYAISGTMSGEDKQVAFSYQDWWKIINEEVFESRLQPLFISREVASYGHWIGLCCENPRHIKLAKAAFKAGHHDNSVIKRLAGFENLGAASHNAAMVILHEMMHQSLIEARKNPDHDSDGWAALCNYVGDVLGLPYQYIQLKEKKEPVLDDNGNPVMYQATDTNGELLFLKSGKPKMVVKRRSIKEPVANITRDESKPLAPYDAFYCFPYIAEDAFIASNTIVKTTGKAVDKNNGEPVTIYPSF